MDGEMAMDRLLGGKVSGKDGEKEDGGNAIASHDENSGANHAPRSFPRSLAPSLPCSLAPLFPRSLFFCSLFPCSLGLFFPVFYPPPPYEFDPTPHAPFVKL